MQVHVSCEGFLPAETSFAQSIPQPPSMTDSWNKKRRGGDWICTVSTGPRIVGTEVLLVVFVGVVGRGMRLAVRNVVDVADEVFVCALARHGSADPPIDEAGPDIQPGNVTREI